MLCWESFSLKSLPVTATLASEATAASAAAAAVVVVVVVVAPLE
jgi:hypothetical protein